MTTNTLSLFPRWGSIGRWHTVIGWLLGLSLVALWLAGYGPGGSACVPGPSASVSTPAASAPAPTTTPATAAIAAAAPAVATPAAAAAPPDAKVYFALDKFDMPDEPVPALAAVIAYLQANPNAKATISGFHDPTGNKAHNEELALNRARTVRSTMEAAGISRDRVVMAKPAETTGTGEAREARRVEVSVQP